MGRFPFGAQDSSAAYASFTLAEGALLARKYRLERPAGFGGMAELWVAKNEATSAEVCIKILVPERNDAESVARFRREAYAAARLSHRAIVRVFDLLELDKRGDLAGGSAPAALAIVMELLHGETLGDALLRGGKLPLAEALDVALPIVSALGHAHAAGVVHRDVKPDNIFLAREPDGHVFPKVLDFGVSKVQSGDTPSVTRDGVMLGTPSFMSPEQARGARHIDARSDVFSIALLLYVMLSGTNPFESDNFEASLSAVIHDPVTPLPDLPKELWEVIERALNKTAAERYADANELGVALRRASGRERGAQEAARSSSAEHDPARTTAESGVVTSTPPGPVGSPAGEGPTTGTVYRARRGRARVIVAAVTTAAAAILLAALVVPAVRGTAPEAEDRTVARPRPTTGEPATLAGAVARPLASPNAAVEPLASEAPATPGRAVADASPPAEASVAIPAQPARPGAAPGSERPLGADGGVSHRGGAARTAELPVAPERARPPGPRPGAPARPHEPSIVRDPGF